MHKISIEELLDYSYCPMLYVLKYKTPEYKTKAINLLEKYDSDIHKVIYQALNRVQSNEEITLKDIKTYWGKEWIKNKNKSKILFGETYLTKDTYSVRRRKGLELLMNFYNKFSEEPGMPIVINQNYEVKINNILTITNNIELIREYNGEIQLITFVTNEYNKAFKINDLKIMADYFVAKTIMEQDIKHYVYNLDKNIMYENKITNKKIKFFKYNIMNIYKCIHNNLYYINSNSHCYNCIYKNVCSGRVNQLIEKIKRW